MKLYSVDLSPYSSRVRMQVYAKGLDHIAIERPAAFLTPEWRGSAPTPIARLPALELDDGQTIPESEVIAEYLEEVYPTPSLLGANPLENAKVRALARIADIYLITNTFALAGGRGRPLSEGPVRDAALAGATRGFEALEATLDGAGGFACLGRLTLADCALTPALFMLEAVLPAAGAKCPIAASAKVGAYWTALRRHPAAARVLGEMRRGLEARLQSIREAEMAAG